MIFDYVERKTRRGESTWSARVPVTIVGGALPLQGRALVDTGADRSHIPLKIGKQMVPLTECAELSMIWGDDYNTKVYAPRAHLLAQIGKVMVPIRPVLGDFGDLVLGMDFLSHFHATFDGAGRRLELRVSHEGHDGPKPEQRTDDARLFTASRSSAAGGGTIPSSASYCGRITRGGCSASGGSSGMD